MIPGVSRRFPFFAFKFYGEKRKARKRWSADAARALSRCEAAGWAKRSVPTAASAWARRVPCLCMPHGCQCEARTSAEIAACSHPKSHCVWWLNVTCFPEVGVSDQIKFVLDETQIPKAWYN